VSEGDRFKLEVEHLPAVFPCDRNLMSLVLRSLADNAVKYTPPGSKIVLSGQATAEGVVLMVADNGLGISPMDLPHLFERFYRGQNTGNKPGTGLSLALARRMVEMQGGTLNLASSPGHGCQVSIFLPTHSKVMGATKL
jgi:signal transduction histidine kinase